MLENRTCILVPTFEGYLASAQLTRRLIDRYWRDHPPVLLCGAAIEDQAALPLRSDARDWMSVVRDGLRDLSASGYEFVYLILADLGPLDRCHEDHLNRTMPGWMVDLDAIYISIRGWDHRRNSSGRNLGQRYLSLQRQRSDYVWRFGLHPALWRIEALIAILDILLNRCPDHSAWAFENEAGKLQGEIPKAWNDGTYRVCGRLMSAAPIPVLERRIRHAIDGLIRHTDRTLNHRNRVDTPNPIVGALFERLLRTNAVYYQGPYPIYFRGFYTFGQVNKHLAHFLVRRGRHDLLSEIEMACPARLGR